MIENARLRWPGPGPTSWLRLAAAVIAAPLLLAAGLSGLAYLTAGSTMANREDTMAITADAAAAFFVFLPGFTFTVGLVGLAVLWRFTLRGVPAWIIVGLVTGAAASAGLSLAIGGAPMPMQMAVAAGLGVTLSLLIRWLAGVRIS